MRGSPNLKRPNQRRRPCPVRQRRRACPSRARAIRSPSRAHRNRLAHVVIRVGGAAPPAASRCCARASLPTPRGEPRFGVDSAPSRGDPPRRASRSRDPIQADRFGTWNVRGGRSPIMRGVGAGRSAQRGTSGATTGPRGAAGPHNPEADLARLLFSSLVLVFDRGQDCRVRQRSGVAEDLAFRDIA